MPFLPDTQTRTVTDFQGPWDPTFIEPTDIALPKGMLAQNVTYLPGKVAQRLGYSAVFTDAEATSGYTSFINWLFEYSGLPRNYFIGYAKGVGVRIGDLANPAGTAATLIVNTSAAGAFAVPAGLRAYVALYDQHGAGLTGGSVFGYPAAAFGFPSSVDPLFAAPIQCTMTVTETGTGVTTAGVHRFGFILTTRSGFTTRWSPVDSSTAFAPVSFTSEGGTVLSVSIAGTWPIYASTLQIIMSTAANPAQYYIVPDAILGVAPGATFTVTASINISDGDLAISGSDPAPYQNLLTQDVTGNPPFKPSALVNYKSRLGYITVDSSGLPVVYFSDPNKPQSITADQHGVYLPGFLQIVTAQPIQQTCYLFGPHWTYSVSDTGDVPALWASPVLIDGSIGTLSPFGVYVNASQSYAWVADEGGLFLFQGSAYPNRPISYYQTPDWNRINWGAPTAVKVIDDKNDKVVRVAAPLDGATTPTHILSWDYTSGTDPEKAHYSLDNIASYSLGAPAIIENPTTRKLETWIAPGAASQPILRKNSGSEANPYRDWNAPTYSQYQTALFPGSDGVSGSLNMFHALRSRLRGVGTLNIQALSLDNSQFSPIFQVGLANLPGAMYQNRYYMMCEAISLLFAMNDLDHHWEMSSLEVAYTEGSPQR